MPNKRSVGGDTGAPGDPDVGKNPPARKKSRLRLLALGGLEVCLVDNHRGSIDLGSRKAGALLALLGLRRRPQSRDQLAAFLWESVPPAQARHSLRQTVHALKRVLDDQAGEILLTNGDFLALNLARVKVDVNLFEYCARGTTARAVDTACRIYRGPFLDGIHLREPSFDLWALNERNRLQQLAITAHHRRIQQLVAEADLHGALEVTLRTLEMDPFHEQTHRTAIELYVHLGELPAAIRHYESLRKLFQDELGIEPDQLTQHIIREAIRHRR